MPWIELFAEFKLIPSTMPSLLGDPEAEDSADVKKNRIPKAAIILAVAMKSNENNLFFS